MNTVLQAIANRRSIRTFTQQPLPRADLEAILQAGIYAPSAMNKQSWRFTVLSSQERIARLAAAVGEVLRRENYDFYRPAALILVSGPRDNSNIFADCSAALENIFLAAYSLGIGSCWINQLKDAGDSPTVRVLLTSYGIPEDHIVCGTAALGYGAATPEPPARKPGTVVYLD